MQKSIIKITGPQKGKTTVIMTGVHGNETSGLLAFQKIIPNITISTGTVYFIIANPKAIKKNVRYIKRNMNRCFTKRISGNTYEEMRARIIKKILDTADCLLDVHNTFNEVSGAFLIGEEQKLAKYFPVKKFVMGIDKVEKGGSDGYMNNKGKLGFCIECGSINDPKGGTVAEITITNFLKLMGNTNGKAKILAKKQTNISCEKIYISKTNNFTLAKNFKDFEDIKKGDCIGYDGQKKVISKIDGVILFAHNANAIGKECFILATYV